MPNDHNPPPEQPSPDPRHQPGWGGTVFPADARGRVVDPDATSEDRTYALLLHLSTLAHLVVGGFAIIIPIVMWQLKKDDSPFLDDHGKEVTNFQISLILYSLITIVLAIITCGVGALLTILVYALGIVGVILGAVAANRGEYYRYPMTIRLIH